MAMTKPEETTAAKKATININIMDAPQVEQALSAAAAMVAWARAERDEQRARAEKAEAELVHVRLMLQERTAMGDEYYAGKQRAENMLAERIRERDEAANKVQLLEAELAATRQLAEMHAGAATRAEDEIDEARDQLAKLEWAGAHGAGCLLCGQMRQAGHRPTCWFAKREAAKEAGSKDRADRYPFPKRAGIGEVTVKIVEPARPEPRFKVGEKVVCEDGATDTVWLWCGWDGGVRDHLYMLCDGRGAHEAELRPVPKYKIGRKANYGGKEVTITDRIYDANSGWYYRVKEHHWIIPECDLKPAPKFAVGEWVTSGDQEVGEI